jgi:hypothetical protein
MGLGVVDAAAIGGVEVCCGFAVLHWVDLPVYPAGFDFAMRSACCSRQQAAVVLWTDSYCYVGSLIP